MSKYDALVGQEVDMAGFGNSHTTTRRWPGVKSGGRPFFPKLSMWGFLH